MAQNFYITTPIYYVNDIPHIGHAYCTILCDVLAKYHKLMGYETFMMTGTDEHGQKVQQAAGKRGVEPQAHVDEYHKHFKELWADLDISYDKFIRTTDSHHKEYVRNSLQQLWDKGEIYIKEYEGWYSVGEERFFEEEELVDGKDPISGKPVDWIKEKNYFFKMSLYQERLIQYIEDHPDFIQPDFRKNEVLGFLRQELRDLCISRPKSRLSWGIPLPFDEDYVAYVWFDALLNYRSGVDGMTFSDGTDFWPASYNVIGKDILTTHSIYWTTMLMAMGQPLPQHILAHGWWLNGGAKISKSSGTAVDPKPYIEKFGVDTFRYYVVRDMVLGNDASFTDDAFYKRINSDLANDLGNGLNRVVKLIQKHYDNTMPAVNSWCDTDEELKRTAEACIKSVCTMIPQMKLSHAIEEIMILVRSVNKYLEVTAPWKLVKDIENEETKATLDTVLNTAAEAVRVALTLLHPVISRKANDGLAMLGTSLKGVESLKWGDLIGGETIEIKDALFPRIEVEKPKQQPKKEEQHPLSKFELMVAEILKVSDHPEADSLYVCTVSTGTEERTVCAGIKKRYTPEELVGKKVVLFANLKPAKIRGIESRGMMLAGDKEPDSLELVNPGEGAVAGSLVQFGTVPVVPKSKVKIKEFDKITLEVQAGTVVCGAEVLNIAGTPISCDTTDGSPVK